MTSGLPNGMLFLFGESRWRFHSLAMYVSSFHRILKENLIQSNKAGSLGSNISKSTISWKDDFHQVCLQQILTCRTQYVDWLERTLLKRNLMHHLHCSIQFCLSVQCWPGIIFAQCWGNLCNVGATFEATGYYEKINRSKIKVPEKGCCSENNTLTFILQNFLWSLLVIAQGF